MKWTIAGLGNPKPEYKGSRHNVGRDFVESLADKLPGKPVIVIPDTYMNDSGKALRKYIKSVKATQTLVVVHDELDLPLGVVKLSFGAGPGGHNGVRSVQQVLKTKNFVRVRIGISPSTAGGKLRKPTGEDVVDFVLTKFKPAEQEKLKKIKKTVFEGLELIIETGVDHAMNVINSK